MRARMARIALYPGSFDPPTNGHLSIIQRGLRMFDGLIVAVLRNPAKDAVFSVDERVELLKEAVNGDPRVQVKTFDGLLVKFAQEQGMTPCCAACARSATSSTSSRWPT